MEHWRSNLPRNHYISRLALEVVREQRSRDILIIPKVRPYVNILGVDSVSRASTVANVQDVFCLAASPIDVSLIFDEIPSSEGAKY